MSIFFENCHLNVKRCDTHREGKQIIEIRIFDIGQFSGVCVIFVSLLWKRLFILKNLVFTPTKLNPILHKLSLHLREGTWDPVKCYISTT